MSCSCSTSATDYAAQICLGPFVTGDQWDGRQFTVWVNNPNFNSALPRTDTNQAPGTGSNPRLVSASNAYADLERVVLQVHTSETQLDTLVDLDSDDAEITINDAEDWVFTIGAYTFTLAAGSYFVAIACKITSAGWKTFFKGTLTLTGKGVLPT